jgi:tRNA A-37 threonylcarbamoyl transferase component Bud32
MQTHTKQVSDSEYDCHKLFLKNGIRTSDIFDWDETTKKLTTTKVDGYVISDLPRLKININVIALSLINEIEKLHNMGYIHGDLNPTNVIVSNNGIYLIDFEFSDEIGSAVITLEEEMIDLVKLLVIIMSTRLKNVANLMSLCEDTHSIRIPFGLKENISYDDLRLAVMG